MNASRSGGLIFAIALFLVGAYAAPATAQDTHLLLVTGIAGTDEHAQKFLEWGTAIVDASKKQGLAETNITYLADKPEADPARIRARSTRENVTKAFGDLASRTKPGDEVFVILIGHGSFDGRQASFNLPGPDLSAADYAPLLGRLSAQQVVFVNTASSSGAFLPVLAGPGKIIVTATKTGGERNETRFPEFFVEGLTGTASDSDRNGRISIFEAFEYARLKVASSYEQTGHIATEHPTLDDGADGNRAAELFLSPRRSRSTAMADASPELRTLLEEQEALEQQLAGLRLRKDSMDAAAYEQELERLVTQIALKSRAIRELEAKK